MAPSPSPLLLALLALGKTEGLDPDAARALRAAERADPGARFPRAVRALGEDRRARWTFRFAVARALAHAAGRAPERAFTSLEADRATGSRTGPLFPLAHGRLAALVPAREDGHRALVAGLEAWLLGAEIEWPGAQPLRYPDELAGEPEVAEVAEKLGGALDLTRPVAFSAGVDLEFAALVAGAIAARRGRRLRAVRTATPGVIAGLLLAADVDGADLFVAAPEEERMPWDDPSDPPGLDVARTGPAALLLACPSGAEDPLGARELDQLVALEAIAGRVVPALAGRLLPGHVVTDLGGLRLGLRRHPLHVAVHGPGVPLPPRPAALDAGHLDAARWEVPTETLDALVLPEETRARLGAIAAAARAGRRAVVLLHGPPGTGKSLAARCLAGTLGRALYRLDGGTLRGMYYGELERRLADVFREAASRGAVLLLDEADEWLGRREGQDLPARETSQLLARLEAHPGVAVLTTNRHASLDPALRRRVDHDLAMPSPGPFERMSLWSTSLGERAALGPTELVVLAAIPLSGGDIRAAVREAEAAGTGPLVARLVAAARRRAEERGLLGS